VTLFKIANSNDIRPLMLKTNHTYPLLEWRDTPMVSIISFDLDGTIMQQQFADSVWLTGLPQLYAKQKDIDIDTARSLLMESYDAMGSDRREWYDLNYWIDQLGLSVTPNDLLQLYRHAIKPFPDAKQVIEHLSKEFTLIISSGAMKEFINIQLSSTGLSNYFSHLFSSTSDTQMVKKDPMFYKKIADTLSVDPFDIVHVGDNEAYDYRSPLKAGLQAFYLDRTSDLNAPYIVHSLTEFKQKIDMLKDKKVG
jgi:HAD superfamily hydrolase (TIGR01493 family)